MNGSPDPEFAAELFPNLHIDDFRIAIAITKAGSLRKAADALRLSQATVSRRLSRLEWALNAKLFDRGPAGPTITAEGRMAIAEAVRMIDTFERMGQRHGAPGAPSGTCRLVVGDGLGACWLTRFLPAFFDAYPDIDLQLNAATDKLGGLSEHAELRIHYWEPEYTSHVAARLGMLHLLCFASQTYAARHGLPQSRDDFKDHKLLEIDQYIGQGLSWASFTEGASSARLFANTSVTLVEAVRNGAGIALLPSYLAALHPELIHIASGPSMSMPLSVSYAREAGKYPQVRATLDFLKAHAFNRQMPWFEDERHLPSAGWKDTLSRLIEDAALSDTEVRKRS
jgi:DNA-binding transcriptional LysR family regulator